METYFRIVNKSLRFHSLFKHGAVRFVILAAVKWELMFFVTDQQTKVLFCSSFLG